MTDKPTLKPCPFCGDPMYVSGDILAHKNRTECAISFQAYPWPEELAAWNTRAAPKVKALEWDVDGRRLRMDDTMRFSKGYDWDGFECLRQEGYGLGFGYIIWPDRLGGAAWNLYGTLDGLFVPDLSSEAEAKAAAQAHFERRILDALE